MVLLAIVSFVEIAGAVCLGGMLLPTVNLDRLAFLVHATGEFSPFRQIACGLKRERIKLVQDIKIRYRNLLREPVAIYAMLVGSLRCDCVVRHLIPL